MRGAAAAPRRSRRIGQATIILVGISSLGFASSQALAGQASPAQTVTETTTSSTTTGGTPPAPAPDPIPSPKPDAKPARPKPRAAVKPPPPPPPAPPAALRRAAPRSTPARAKTGPTRRSIAAPTGTRSTQRSAPAHATTRPTRRSTPSRATTTSRQATARLNRPKVVVAKMPNKPARAAETPADRRLRVSSVSKVRREAPATRRKRAVARKRNRTAAVAAPDVATLDLQALPTPVSAQSKPKLSTAVPLVLPLAGFGLLLLLGASAVSFRRVQWPAFAEPLYARRSDLAAIGLGAIALALLVLNATVIF
jgi:hypothetical protein